MTVETTLECTETPLTSLTSSPLFWMTPFSKKEEGTLVTEARREEYVMSLFYCFTTPRSADPQEEIVLALLLYT